MLARREVGGLERQTKAAMILLRQRSIKISELDQGDFLE
jgi:hypothetical protein